MKPLSHYETVLAYHERTKHHFERYARGPGQINWDAQPDSFRHYTGVQCFELPLVADTLTCTYIDLYHSKAIAPRPMTLSNIAALLELSLGFAAWKEYATHRWVLRCTPSSGNLHPTEGYVILPNITSLPAGVYHYISYDHLLEQRGSFEENGAKKFEAALSSGRFLLGLSSIPWRSSWKYGERAFRYCQLDIGHAIAAVRYAAATLGWSVQLLDHWAEAEMSMTLGLNQEEDFSENEREVPGMLLCINTQGERPQAGSKGEKKHPFSRGGFERSFLKGEPEQSTSKEEIESSLYLSENLIVSAMAGVKWVGKANVLDPKHQHEWPIIDSVLEATIKPATEKMNWTAPPLPLLLPLTCTNRAAELIRQRRSAQMFDATTPLSLKVFYRLLDSTLPRKGVVPWDTFQRLPRIHLVLFVHRVTDLSPGLYVLLRREGIKESLHAAFQSVYFEWVKPNKCPKYLPFYQLVGGDPQTVAQQISCNQEIAADSAFSLGMLAEFENSLKNGAWHYRQLFWEAGIVGQVLYLEAEAAGVRGTGVGCFFDDAFHTMLGLTGTHYQSMYHFTVGTPLTDKRLKTLPPYEHLQRRKK
ncbi:MAG: nitroreductase [Gammaproteobacteria bacterium]|nr:MAG: nitroreductase [Gammaproteobacteria bacterium]RKZ39848.1 MAG: nitroreductase [Gammaproteobacteria bacterium]RKZ75454.1 MAG: nitroreductase [Gammaproteobacteria bacterium]